MKRWPRGALSLRAALVAAVFCLASAAGAAGALGAPPPGSGGAGAPAGAGAPQGGAGQKKKQPAQSNNAATSTGQLTVPGALSAPGAAKQLGSSGQVDPITGLGIRNPVCDQLSQIRDPKTRLSCEANGTPESNYPASNYGFDIFIDTGLFSSPAGTFTKGFVMILNGIWLGLIFVLKLVLALLGLAFGLNPFADGQTMSQISGAVGRMYERITDPWLSTLVVCGGIWFAYKGLLRRELAASVAGTLAAIAMLVMGLWVVHQPAASVGQLASLSDEVALGVIGAPQSGSVSRPAGSYAEAMSRTWSRLVEVPFAGLDFSDVRWALGPPPPEAVQKANQRFCDDVGALALLAVLSQLGSDQAKAACARFAAKRYGRPRRVIDLYLRSSPGSPARQALWDYFNANPTYKPKVAAQGGDGVLTRLSMLALFAVGLLGAILLLAWLAIRLFTQAAIAFVLLLAAPFALFFPLLGDSGRRAFKTWGLTLLGAIAAKVIYAAFLSIVLAGISILGQVNGPAGSATGFLLSCAFTWSVFLKRAELVGWISIGDAEPAGRGFIGKIAAFTIARRMSQGVSGALRGVGRRGTQWTRTRAAEGAEATRETAKGSLQRSARALADQRYREAQRTVRAFEGNNQQSSAGRPDKGRKGSLARDASSNSEKKSPAARPDTARFQEARQLIARADRNQRSFGERWSERDLDRFGKEDRALLERSKDPVEHAHRAGYDRAQFEQLRGPERERAEAAIEQAVKRDRQRLDVASSVPGRVAGRGRQAAEWARQRGEGAAPDRREHLRRLRRDRRAATHLPRRNLSRGS